MCQSWHPLIQWNMWTESDITCQRRPIKISSILRYQNLLQMASQTVHENPNPLPSIQSGLIRWRLAYQVWGSPQMSYGDHQVSKFISNIYFSAFNPPILTNKTHQSVRRSESVAFQSAFIPLAHAFHETFQWCRGIFNSSLEHSDTVQNLCHLLFDLIVLWSHRQLQICATISTLATSPKES